MSICGEDDWGWEERKRISVPQTYLLDNQTKYSRDLTGC